MVTGGPSEGHWQPLLGPQRRRRFGTLSTDLGRRPVCGEVLKDRLGCWGRDRWRDAAAAGVPCWVPSARPPGMGLSSDGGGRPGALWGLLCTWRPRDALWASLGSLSLGRFRCPKQSVSMVAFREPLSEATDVGRCLFARVEGICGVDGCAGLCALGMQRCLASGDQGAANQQ